METIELRFSRSSIVLPLISAAVLLYFFLPSAIGTLQAQQWFGVLLSGFFVLLGAWLGYNGVRRFSMNNQHSAIVSFGSSGLLDVRGQPEVLSRDRIRGLTYHGASSTERSSRIPSPSSILWGQVMSLVPGRGDELIVSVARAGDNPMWLKQKLEASGMPGYTVNLSGLDIRQSILQPAIDRFNAEVSSHAQQS